MDLFEAIKNRRSVRNFTNDPVAEEDLEKILEAANWAPSARNKQPWRFIVVKNHSVVAAMEQAVNDALDVIAKKAQSSNNEELLKKAKHYRTPFTFFAKAPVTVAVVRTIYEGTGLAKEVGVDASKYDSAFQSVAAAIQNFLLATHALEYGSCWMTGHLVAEPEISKLLELEDDEQLMALLPVGKYSLPPKAKPRKSANQVTTFIN